MGAKVGAQSAREVLLVLERQGPQNVEYNNKTQNAKHAVRPAVDPRAAAAGQRVDVFQRLQAHTRNADAAGRGQRAGAPWTHGERCVTEESDRRLGRAGRRPDGARSSPGPTKQGVSLGQGPPRSPTEQGIPRRPLPPPRTPRPVRREETRDFPRPRTVRSVHREEMMDREGLRRARARGEEHLVRARGRFSRGGVVLWRLRVVTRRTARGASFPREPRSARRFGAHHWVASSI